MRKYEEVVVEGRGQKVESPKVQESQGPRVQRSMGLMVPGSQGLMVQKSKGPRYLKVIFKYELDSEEGPSCFIFHISNIIT